MKQLDLLLFGTPTIYIDGKKLSSLSSRKAQALLYYLAVGTKPVTRDTVAALLWPEMKPQAAKHNLRTTLNSLKQHLEPYLDITPKTVALNRATPISSDIEHLRLRLDKAIAQQDIKELLDAVTCYQGEFLQGFYLRNAALFDEWMLQEREQWHLIVLQALETLVLFCIEQGNYRTGIDASRKLLAMEPWSEAGHRQLMTLFALNGQRSRALQQYELCCRVLAEESATEPALETTVLYHQILAGQLTGPMLHLETTAIRPSISQEPAFLDPVEAEPTTTNSRSQLVLPNAQSVAPAPLLPLPTRTPNNLHVPLSTFIGRQQECTTIIDHLLTAENRLLTITGLGGVGKSALALMVGNTLLSTKHEFRSGIFFVSLAEIKVTDKDANRSDAEGPTVVAIVTAIAQALGYHFETGKSPQSQLIDFLRHRQLLLILDNFDHLVDYATIVVDLLKHIPSLRLLITSRSSLKIRGETVFQLNGLSLISSLPLATTDDAMNLQIEPVPLADPPEPVPASPPHPSHNELQQVSEAVLLFINCAKSADPMFALDPAAIDAITRLCHAVAGLPLAIEMAAAWIPFYSCEEIALRLTGESPEVDLLVSHFQDQPPRHRTLQQVFDDSWGRLSAEVQLALARLSVFSGQFTRDAAQAVAHVLPTTLMELRDHSLLYTHGQSIYSLHPLSKHFATRKWIELTLKEPARHKHLHQAHCDYYLKLLTNFANQSNRTHEIHTIKQLQRDHIELTRAWRWAIQQNEWPVICRAMGGLFRYLELTNQSTEGKLLFAATLTVNEMAQTTPLQASVNAWIHTAHCHFLRRLADHGQARRHLEAQLAAMPVTLVATDTDTDTETETVALPDYQEQQLLTQAQTFTQCVLGWVYYEQGEYDLAADCFTIAHQQAEQSSDYTYLIDALNGLGAVAFSRKQYKAARIHYRSALPLAQERADLHYTAIILGNLAASAQATKSFVQAEQYLQMRLEIDKQTHNTRQMAISYHRLGQLALHNDAYAKAETYLRKSIAHFKQMGHGPEISHVVLDLSKSLLRRQQLKSAKMYCLYSLQLAIQAQMSPRILAALTILAEIYVAEEQKSDALPLLKMVTSNNNAPAVTWRTAHKLQTALVAELAKCSSLPATPNLTEQSLQEFGQQLLLHRWRSGVDLPL